ncbi:MAG: FAD:protein FMN transferase [Phycisphaerae bacterium]|jgi:thiamine biosynthesis lipoprotein|nr:FAD:protein FMN transferase [Phycisphaerae bacterium]MDP7289606.1 FAD:protein FMN transferase [Phycisphaerae bacterium]
MGDTEPNLHRFAHEAMTVTFEAVIAHADAELARQAAGAAFAELDRLDRLMSRFDACSDIARVNRLKPGECVGVDIAVFECLATAAHVWADTLGAFDVTIGAVMDYKETDNVPPSGPEDESPDEAFNRVGMTRLILDRNGFLVGVREVDGIRSDSCVSVDLGAIGKGVALDRMLDVLDDWDIRNALVHGGTSTVRVVGSPGVEEGWPVAVGGPWAQAAGIERVVLTSGAVSGSGTQARGEHIVDPRSGGPADGPLAAWIICRSGAVADALSTALMVMFTDEVENYCRTHEHVTALLVMPDDNSPHGGRIERFGPASSDYFEIF